MSSSSSSADTKKGTWSKEEDEILKAYVKNHGTRNWNELSKKAGLVRCGKSCRLRWYNHLQPDVKKGPFSEEEKRKVFQFYKKFGEFKWSKLAQELPGRSDNDIKNFWNVRKRKLGKRGLSPFPDDMEPDDELNISQQQEDEFIIPQLKFRKYPSIFDEINEKLLDVPNMFYNNINVGSTSTLIDRGSIGTSHIPMAPLPSRMMLGEYPQIPPPMETQYQKMSESTSPYKSGSLENDVAAMNPDFWLYNSSLDNDDVRRVQLSETNFVDEKGKKHISLEDDVEANDFMDPCLLIDFSNLEDDVEANFVYFTNRLDNGDNIQ